MQTHLRWSSIDPSSYKIGMQDENLFSLLAEWEVLEEICLSSHLLFLLCLFQSNI